MGMNREAYELANRIEMRYDRHESWPEERLSEADRKKYKKEILWRIRGKKRKGKALRGVYAAACAVLVLLAGTIFFGDDVHAMITQISWKIESAIGISGNLADYSEAVGMAAADNGYVVTLQEAVVSEEKLLINYTLQREDGGAIVMPDPLDLPNLDSTLYIDGKKMNGAVAGSCGFIDDEHTVLGMASEYFLKKVDFSEEHRFQINIHRSRIGTTIEGEWEFVFQADGSDLLADTRRITLDKTFTLPNGGSVTLQELTSNALEQRITYALSDGFDYSFHVKAVDSTGKQAEFGVRMQDEKTGHMQNEQTLYDGRLAEEAETVTMTLYVKELPKESGKESGEEVQIGEPFTLKLP